MPEGQSAINLPIDLASQLASVPVFQLLTNEGVRTAVR